MARHETIRWAPPIELSKEEEAICKRCKRTGRLFAFLRRHRHELFDEALQVELSEMYKDSPLGQPPTPPALLGLVTILQAVDGTSDAVAVEEAAFNKRWQMVLDCIGEDEPAFSQGNLVDFRNRLMEHGLHYRLVEKSVELAKKTGDFGYKQLRVALDSAPLWGAGRVEDTFNLIGHALEVVVSCASAISGKETEIVRKEAGLQLLGGKSLKASLDIDWDDGEERHRALQCLLEEVQRLRSWLESHLAEESNRAPLKEAVEQLEGLLSQDLEPEPEGGGMKIKRGVAKDRQISICDPEMRHGRKSRSRVIEGYKRFIARDLDHGLIVGVTVQPANQAERDAAKPLCEQASRYGEVRELHIDRAFLSSQVVDEVEARDGLVSARPWNVSNRGRYPKTSFEIDLDSKTATCPAGQTTELKGKKAQFPASACDACEVREQCTRAKRGRGRSLSIHPKEGLLIELRKRKATPEGRELLRQRVDVEHGLAHICNRQGRRARYIGVEKNIFDLCRYAVVENLFAAERALRAAA